MIVDWRFLISMQNIGLELTTHNHNSKYCSKIMRKHNTFSKEVKNSNLAAKITKFDIIWRTKKECLACAFYVK